MGPLEALKHLPRFSKGSIELGGLSIHYNDPQALYNEYSDIFINRIYHFTPRCSSPVILDVGGYIGLSVMYFKQNFPGARVTVFEPDPTIFNILKTNMEANGFNDVALVNAGVGKEAGKVRFFPDGADGGNVFAGDRDALTQVNMVRLSDHINERVDLLKMNIEGMEGEVLEEIEPKLSFINEIMFEYHAFYDLPQQLGTILNRLDRSGFRYLVTDVPCARTPVPFKMNKNYQYFHLVYAGKIKG